MQFFAVQLARPAALLVQFGLLARFMTTNGYATFATAYASAILVSVLSDFGQRQIAFAAMRTADSRGRTTVVGQAESVKLVGSVVVLVGSLCAFALGLLGLGAAIGLALLSVTVPISDVAAALLRGDNHPRTELGVGLLEQVVLTGLIVAMWKLGGTISVGAALLSFGLVGVARMAVLITAARRRFHVSGLPPIRLGRRFWLKSTNAAASIFVAVLVARLPAGLFPALLTRTEFAVFISFWNLFQRLELVIGSVIQAGYKRATGVAARISARPALVCLTGFAVGVAVLSPTLIAPDFVTRVYLGARYAGGSHLGIVAAGLVTIHLPLFGIRSLLQFMDRALLVTVTLTAAAVVSIASTVALHPTGPVVAVPYGLSLLAAVLVLSWFGWRPNKQEIEVSHVVYKPSHAVHHEPRLQRVDVPGRDVGERGRHREHR